MQVTVVATLDVQAAAASAHFVASTSVVRPSTGASVHAPAGERVVEMLVAAQARQHASAGAAAAHVEARGRVQPPQIVKATVPCASRLRHLQTGVRHLWHVRPRSGPHRCMPSCRLVVVE